MPLIFGRGTNLAVRLALFGAAGIVVALALFFWLWPFSEWATGVGYPIAQPVPFSHEHHVAQLGIDCRFCHATVEKTATAGMPPTYTCMTCHSQVWTNAQMLAPVRQSLASDVPIHWQRVNQLPDYVYFDHSIHIAKGIGCETCHGRVDQMPLMEKQANLRMEWCLDCHRDPAPNLRPPDAIFDMAWQPTAKTPTGDQLMDFYKIHPAGLTDCSVCHR